MIWLGNALGSRSRIFVVGREQCNNNSVKFGVAYPHKPIQGCLTGLFPREYGEQTNALCWQEFMMEAPAVWAGFGESRLELLGRIFAWALDPAASLRPDDF